MTEIGEINSSAVERVALVTGARRTRALRPSVSSLRDASQDRVSFLAFYVLNFENKHVVLLTSTYHVRLGDRIWRFPPQDVVLDSSSRSDSRGILLCLLLQECGLSVNRLEMCTSTHVTYSTLNTGFICSLGLISN